MNDRPTPETDAFYATFADGVASPSQDEWLERLKRYERQRDGLLEALERIVPRTSDKWAREACEDAIAAVREGKP